LCVELGSEPVAQAGEELSDLLLLHAPELGEELRDVVVTFLAGLELEHAVARTQLEVQRERREEVLKGLVGLASVAEVADADSHAAQLGAWPVGQEGEIEWGLESVFVPL
jgi:hypothetical protein